MLGAQRVSRGKNLPRPFVDGITACGSPRVFCGPDLAQTGHASLAGGDAALRQPAGQGFVRLFRMEGRESAQPAEAPMPVSPNR